MARLPDASSLGERPLPQTPRGIAQYRPTTGLEGEASQELAKSGQEMQTAAALVFHAKEEQDTLAAEDAFSKLRQKQLELTYGENGINTVKGAAAMNRDLPTEYGNKLQGTASELAAGLGNDYQRKLFAKRSTVAQLQLQEHAYQHVARESDVYANQVLQGTLDTESRLAAAGAPAEISLERINAAIDRHARRFGTAEQDVTALKLKSADTIWTAKVKSLIYSDPFAAQALYKQHLHEFGPINRVVLEHEIKNAIKPIEAKTVAEAAMTVPQVSGPLDLSALEAAIIKVEGSGPEAVSVQGARGRAQITEATFNAYKKPGESFDKEEDRLAAARRKIAADYEFYGKDVKKTAAAYIGGRGAIDEQGNIRNVKDALGTTAVAYAEKVASLVGASPTNKADTQAMLGIWISNAERMAEATHPNDPVFRDLVIQQVKGYVATAVAAQDGASRQAHGTLIDIAIGGPEAKNPKPLTPEELLATPQAKQAWSVLSPESRRGLLGLVAQNAHEATTGNPIRTDAKVFEDLWTRISLPDNDPRKLRNEMQLAPYLAHGINKADYNWLAERIRQRMTDDGQRLDKERDAFFQAVKAQFDKSTFMVPDPIGGEQFLAFKQYVLGLERKMRSDPNANPYSLYTVGTKDYAGNQIPMFQRSLEQRIRSMTEPLQPQKPPAGTVSEGRIGSGVPEIVNTQTGERLILKDGKWQKK